MCGMTCEGIILKGLWKVPNRQRYKLPYVREAGEEIETDSSFEDKNEDGYEDSYFDTDLTSYENL